MDQKGIAWTKPPNPIIPNCNKRIEQEARDGDLKNLSTYKLNPKGVKGKELLSHMVYFCKPNNEGTGDSKYTMEASDYLNVKISESNTEVLKNTNRLIAGENIDAKCPILKDAYGAGTFQHTAKRRLDSCDTVKAHCGFANDPERLQRFENLIMLTTLVAVINAMKHNNKESKEKETNTEMNQIIETLIELLLKLKENLSLKKTITKKHLAVSLFVKYDMFVDTQKVKRDALVTQLKNKIDKNHAALRVDDGANLSLLNGFNDAVPQAVAAKDDDEEEDNDVNNDEEKEEEEC